jgi:hypothetical protein
MSGRFSAHNRRSLTRLVYIFSFACHACHARLIYIHRLNFFQVSSSTVTCYKQATLLPGSSNYPINVITAATTEVPWLGNYVSGMGYGQ